MREIETATPLEVTRGGYAAWNSGNVDAFVETVHPEIVWVTAGVFPGLRSIYSGHAGMREFWRAFYDPWETLEIEMVKSLEVDADSVLVLAQFHARGRDGIEADRQMVNHLTVRDRKLYRMRVYADWDEALAELGIEDPDG